MSTTGPLAFDDFCQRLLRIFERGRVSATYKHAVMLSLLDVVVRAGNPAPTTISTRDVARAAIALHWPHTRPFKYRDSRTRGLPDDENAPLVACRATQKRTCDAVSAGTR